MAVDLTLRDTSFASAEELRPLLWLQVTTWYEERPHSCFLYMHNVCLTSFGMGAKATNLLPLFMDSFRRMSIATFKLLQSTTLVENPDVVDDYFELCGKVLRCQPPMMLEATDLLPLIFECGTAALLLQHKEAARSALRFFDNLVDLFSRPGRGVTPLSRASLDALRSMLGSRGQQLVTAIVQAIAGELPASRVRFYSPLLKLLVEFEPRLCTTWATVAVQALPVDTHADGAVFVGSIFSTEALRDEKLFTAAADAFSDACRRKRTLVLGRRASSCDRELGR